MKVAVVKRSGHGSGMNSAKAGPRHMAANGAGGNGRLGIARNRLVSGVTYKPAAVKISNAEKWYESRYDENGLKIGAAEAFPYKPAGNASTGQPHRANRNHRRGLQHKI